MPQVGHHLGVGKYVCGQMRIQVSMLVRWSHQPSYLASGIEAEDKDGLDIYKNVSQSLVYRHYNSIDWVNAAECFTATSKLLEHLCCAKN